MIHPERIKPLNTKEVADQPYVVYWMQSAQRAECNHALEYAVRQANLLQKPLIVFFGITEDFPEANERHYRFMLEGLKEVKAALAKRKIQLLIQKLSPQLGALEIAGQAALMVVDCGYLRIERAWREAVAKAIDCPLVQVECNVIVPVESASPKEEYAARTIRPKINKLLEHFAQPLQEQDLKYSSLDIQLPFAAFDIANIDLALAQLKLDRSVQAGSFIGGTDQAKLQLDDFIRNKLTGYAEFGNDPGLDYASNLSPYLHFGQIAPLYIYQTLNTFPPETVADFIEELVIRRELSMNFVFYNDAYDSYLCLPDWAKATLDKHRGDERLYQYSLEELETATTHDPYWNAAQQEMVLTGKMHGYMRMYWGKKILEWTNTPEAAYEAALYLNNKYNLDGRDPNGFAGIAWCFGKHDRPWKEREIFGTVRYMNAKGLDRKFDMDRYLEKVGKLT